MVRTASADISRALIPDNSMATGKLINNDELPESSSYEYVWGDYTLHFDGQRTVAAYAFRTDSTFSHNVLATMPPATLERMERHMKAIIRQYMQRMTDDKLVITADNQ